MIQTARARWLVGVLALAGCVSTPTPKPGPGTGWSDASARWADLGSPPVSALPANTGAPPSPAPPDPFERETWVSLARWAEVHRCPSPERVVSGSATSWSVRGAGGEMRFRPTRLGATWEGIEVHLGFPPQLVGDQPYVHRLDIRKTLNPLLLEPRIAALAGQPMVVIDPGHGGADPGTLNINGGPQEKSFALDWGLRLQRRLQAAGWQAALTRTNDAYLSLADRVAIADRLRADVFISLHFNSASPNTNLWGIETYCLTPTGSASHLTRGFFDGPEQAFPNNAFDLENLLLACRVHRAVVEIPGNRDRGVRRARFLGVLRPQQRPAILIEGGYLSNPEEARRIATEPYREALAEAVARALLGMDGGASLATLAPPGAGTALTP